jgi:hypothetical protein
MLIESNRSLLFCNLIFTSCFYFLTSRSDMVKVESEQTSGHTSGDELETTTSSDIEIISR